MPPKRDIESFFTRVPSPKRPCNLDIENSTSMTKDGNVYAEKEKEANTAPSMIDVAVKAIECERSCCSDSLSQQKPYQPRIKQFNFKKKGRSFQESWYSEFQWLTVCSSRCKSILLCMPASS